MLDVLVLGFLIAFPLVLFINYRLGRVIDKTLVLTKSQLVSLVDAGRFIWIGYTILDIVICIIAFFSLDFTVIIISVIAQLIMGCAFRPMTKKIEYLASLGNDTGA